jgi:hypothetical protein
MQKIFYFLLASTISFMAFAQTTPARQDSFPEAKPRALYMLAHSYGDSVVLRWAPREATFWKAANRTGYIVRRYLVEDKKPATRSVPVVLTPQPIKPWTLDEWKAKARREDTVSAMAAQALYGKIFTLNSDKKGMNMQEIMNAKTEQDNRHGFALMIADRSPFAANGMALRFVDRTFEKSKTYVYTVHALVNSKSVKSDTAAVLVNTSQIPPLPEMPPITVEQLDKAVKFSWDREMAGMFFTAYFLERSEDNGKTFKLVSRQPYIQPVSAEQAAENPPITLLDSLPKNYQRYLYRIYGITPFGEQGKSSEALPVMGRDRTAPGAPQQLTAENFRSNDVRLRWQKTVQEADFSGYLIGRSENVDGPFVPLTLQPLPKNATEFTDTSAVSYGTNYYVVAAMDTANNAGLSVPAYVIMKDDTPPIKPTGVSGKIDTTGIASIQWKLGLEPDLLGYLVYYANAPDHAFTPLSKDFVVDTTFTDSVSLRTLTKNIYYKIVAFDKNRNPSPYSDILELKKPDKLPPVPAVFADFRVSDTTVYMTWAPSTSTDLSSQLLYRREKGGEWKEYTKFDSKTDRFTDKGIKKQAWYEYSLVSVDDTGLQSEMSFPLNVRVYDSGVRQQIENFTAKVAPDGKTIQLSWKYPAGTDFRFMLYRSYNNSGLITYKAIPAGEQSFIDQLVKQGEYEYALKAVYADGGESLLLKTNKINLTGR